MAIIRKSDQWANGVDTEPWLLVPGNVIEDGSLSLEEFGLASWIIFSTAEGEELKMGDVIARAGREVGEAGISKVIEMLRHCGYLD